MRPGAERRRTARTFHCLIGGAAFVLGPGVCGAAEWDARALGLGGCALLHRLAASPGAPVAPGSSFQCGSSFAFLGSGLGEHQVGLQRIRNHHGWALEATHGQSDVHARTEVALALQARGGVWCGGASVGVANTRFEHYGAWTDTELRLGIGVTWRERARCVGVGRQELGSDPVARFAIATAWRLLPALDLVVQAEREPGMPLHLTSGGVIGDETRLAVLGGFDLATFGTSGGVVASAGDWRFTYSTQTHPDLGWSHAWALAFRR